MPNRSQSYGTSFNNVVATGTAMAPLARGKTFQRVGLKLGGTSFLKSHIDLIRVKQGSKSIIDVTGTQLDKINNYRGATADVAFLDVPFADYALNNEVDRMASAFDTTEVAANRALTIEVKINGATAPVLTPIWHQSEPQRAREGQKLPWTGVVGKMLRYPYSVSNGGRIKIDLPFGPALGTLIKRIHVFHGGNMTGATLRKNQVVEHESIKAENEFYQKTLGRVPQANMYTLDFVVDGSINTALNTRNAASLEFLPEFSAADSGEVVLEMLDDLDNL